MSVDEIVFAGGKDAKKLPMWYFVNGQFNTISNAFWLISPQQYAGSWSAYVAVYTVENSLGLSSPSVNSWTFARPVTSLKSCVLWKSGDGSAYDPYEIIENGGC